MWLGNKVYKHFSKNRTPDASIPQSKSSDSQTSLGNDNQIENKDDPFSRNEDPFGDNNFDDNNFDDNNYFDDSDDFHF